MFKVYFTVYFLHCKNLNLKNLNLMDLNLINLSLKDLNFTNLNLGQNFIHHFKVDSPSKSYLQVVQSSKLSH